MAETTKVSIPSEAPPWFQAFGTELNKRLDRLQQQIDQQGERLRQLEATP